MIGKAFRDPIEPMNKKPTLDVRDTLAENIRKYTEPYLLTLGHDSKLVKFRTRGSDLSTSNQIMILSTNLYFILKLDKNNIWTTVKIPRTK